VSPPGSATARLTPALLTRFLQAGLLAVLVVAFWLLSLAFPFFPPPTAVAGAAVRLVGTGEVYPHLLTTLYETGFGFAIAAVLGVAIGYVLGTYRVVADVFEPLVLSAYAVPKIVLLPLLLTIFGVGLEAKIANAAIHGVFPIVLNTVVGVREVSRVLLKLARSLRAGPGQTFGKVVVPSMALPVFAGLRLALGLAFLGALLAELFESKVGLGFLVLQFYNTAQIGKMLAVILLVFILTMALNAGLERVERRLARWRVAWSP
jgi:NitT/TauT family transport system permease protein